PLPALYPDCPAFKEITQVARRLVKFGAGKIDNSAQRLLESTRKFYEKKIACGNREA
ncbi:MAG: hypothetical protein GY765_00455, partial [bacterium]|nr:hypothetical protein [bacterium]